MLNSLAIGRRIIIIIVSVSLGIAAKTSETRSHVSAKFNINMDNGSSN